MSIKLGTQDIAGISQNTNVNAHSLFDFKWTDHKLNEISWLEASTFSWQSGDVYTSAYNHLVQDIQGTTAETETIGSYTVTFYRATDGHKICLADQEQTVLNIYNTYGIAWYYILDTANTQFKLPRTKYGFEGLRTNVGDNISESLPTPSHTHTRGDMNITGSAVFANLATKSLIHSSNGAFSNSDSYEGGWGQAQERNENWSQNLNFNAANNWTGSTSQPNGLPSVYQNNAPVQERATQMYLYFYVGDYSQSAIEQTAGLNSELFNGKADVDLSNVPASKGILTESYVNGTSWYRVYSDGWCEQGGVIGTTTVDGTSRATVTLLKEYVNTQYNISTSVRTMVSVMINNITTSSFRVTTGLHNISYYNSTVEWRAAGYIS